jgi:hypothetical protein
MFTECPVSEFDAITFLIKVSDFLSASNVNNIPDLQIQPAQL